MLLNALCQIQNENVAQLQYRQKNHATALAPPKVNQYKRKFEVTFIKASRVYVHLFRSSSK